MHHGSLETDMTKYMIWGVFILGLCYCLQIWTLLTCRIVSFMNAALFTVKQLYWENRK